MTLKKQTTFGFTNPQLNLVMHLMVLLRVLTVTDGRNLYRIRLCYLFLTFTLASTVCES